jgi:uncharacterized phage protein gp47/JayE
MSIDFRTFQNIVDQIRSDISSSMDGTIDPTIFGKFERAFGDGLGGRAFDIELSVQQLLLQLFPDTATGIFLEKWASYENITRLPATGSSGFITFTGTVSSVIPVGTTLQTTDAKLYTTQTGLTLTTISISVTSLTRSGSTVTATTASDHQIASGQDVTIAGAVETDYNGTFEVTVTGTDTFTYTITGTPTTPATGTITAAFDGGSVQVESSDIGLDQNQVSGTQLSLVSPIAGVDTTAWVQFTELGGGADEEEDGPVGQGVPGTLRFRVFQSRRNPVANFNVAAIEKVVLAVAGVTRTKVKRITPGVGDVTILFVRDNDTNIIPSAGEVQDVKDAVIEDLPATSDVADVIVTAPTPVTTAYTFSAISPDTATMRTAIENNLAAFYRNNVTFEEDVTEDRYRAAITNTIDPDTGATLASFTLSTPSGDITVTTDEIGVLGTVTFP